MRRTLLVLLFVAGCKNEPPPVSFTAEARELTAEDYGAVLERWTREERLYDGLNSILFANSTFHSPEFRRAFAARYPEMYGSNNDPSEELLGLGNEAEEFHTFFVAAYTNNRHWNDFESPNSIWRIALRTSQGDREVEPASIVLRKRNANLERVYPFFGNFRKGYLLRFPKTFADDTPVLGPEIEWFAIRFASSLGSAELVWRVQH